MKLENVSVVAEIVSAFAVVVSLIFVGLQIRDNTIASQAATLQASVGHDLELLLNVGRTPATARVFFTFRDSPNALDGDELLQGQALFTAAFRAIENLYYQHATGMLSDEVWAAREGLVRSLALSPAADEMLSGSNGVRFSGPFLKYVEEVRSRLICGANDGIWPREARQIVGVRA